MRYPSSRLDTEVAVRCFDFRWFASGQTNKKTGKECCSLHVPSSWEKHGWIRWNFNPSRDELPRGTIWPEGEYEPFDDWSSCVGKELDPPYRGTEWSGLPPFSQDWRACGMVVEWLHKHRVNFKLKETELTYSRNGSHFTIKDWKSVKEAFCLLAIHLAKQEKIDFPDSE